MANATQNAKIATDETVAAAKENVTKAVEAGRQAFERNAEVGRDGLQEVGRFDLSRPSAS